MEAWADVCRWGSLPEPVEAISMANTYFFAGRLHCYTPNKPALSSHFPKTAVSGGSGTQVGMVLGLQRQF